MSTPIAVYCQCDSNKIIFVDSLRNEIDSIQTNPIYVLNNEKDTLYLDQLYNADFTRQSGELTYRQVINDSLPAEQKDTTRYCVRCNRKTIKIIDSIDINKDGVKELFLFREWVCSALPILPIFNPYDVGGQQQYYSKVEVWDVLNKNKIFEVINRSESQVATSVSVIRSYGYRFEVHIDRKGHFQLSNQADNRVGELEMGSYMYDNESGTYKRK